mgnify:CR=1 FL=1|tara:strand:- start:11834 stop:12580 length:747 start_codon:yes stop_codon:yes gene_type:complete
MRAVWNILAKFSPFKKRRGTVRYMFPALATIIGLLGAAVITSTDVSYVRLQTNSSLVEAGKEFSVDVYAYAHVPVNAVDITIAFEPGSVEVKAVDIGQSVLTIWTEEPIIEDDKVILRGGTFRKGFLKEHMIARIDLKAKETGSQQVSVSDVMLLAGDGEGSFVETSTSTNGSVSFFVYDENVDPESISVNVEVRVVTDIDGDGEVSLKDISAFMAAWSNGGAVYDFNNDGRMTFRDFSIILADAFFK